MEACKKYHDLPQEWKDKILKIIRKMTGKANVADIVIEDSNIAYYDFKISVLKFNSQRGWATVGYVRNDLFNGGVWRLTYKPRLRKGETLDRSQIGRTQPYS